MIFLLSVLYSLFPSSSLTKESEIFVATIGGERERRVKERKEEKRKTRSNERRGGKGSVSVELFVRFLLRETLFFLESQTSQGIIMKNEEKRTRIGQGHGLTFVLVLKKKRRGRAGQRFCYLLHL